MLNLEQQANKEHYFGHSLIFSREMDSCCLESLKIGGYYGQADIRL